MTITVVKDTYDAKIKEFTDFFPVYSIRTYRGDKSILYIFDKGWFGNLIAFLYLNNAMCLTNKKELAEKLNLIYPKIDIRLYPEGADLYNL